MTKTAGGRFLILKSILVIRILVIEIYLELACLPQAGNLVIGYLKRFYSQEV